MSESLSENFIDESSELSRFVSFLGPLEATFCTTLRIYGFYVMSQCNKKAAEPTRVTTAIENWHKKVKGKQSSEALCMYRALFFLVI